MKLFMSTVNNPFGSVRKIYKFFSPLPPYRQSIRSINFRIGPLRTGSLGKNKVVDILFRCGSDIAEIFGILTEFHTDTGTDTVQVFLVNIFGKRNFQEDSRTWSWSLSI